MKKKQPYYYPTPRHSPFPCPFPCPFPPTCCPPALPPAGPHSEPLAPPSSCWPTLPGQAPASHQLAPSSPGRPQGPLSPHAPWSPLLPLLPLPCQPPFPTLPPLFLPGLPLCSSLFLCPGPPFWPLSGLQPPGQTAQPPLLPSHPVTSSHHLPTLGPPCKPSQGPGPPASGHLDLSGLREWGTCWAQGAAQAWQVWGSLEGPPELQEAPISRVSSQPRGGLAWVTG